MYGAMHGVVALRQVCLKEDRLEEVMSGVFFKPNQRLLLWMGGLRPTDLLVCARIKACVSPSHWFTAPSRCN